MPSGEVEVKDAPGEPSGDDESPEELLHKCANLDDAQAWNRFLRRFHPWIVASVSRTLRRYGFEKQALCDDLVQDVYLKFLNKNARILREFTPLHPGAVFGFVAVVAANVVHDHFKSKGGKHPGHDPLPEQLAAPGEADWRLLIMDIENVFRQASVSTRDRQIFWLYYRQGMTARQIAAISSFKLSTKGVEAVLVRLKELIRKAFGND